MQYKAFVSSTFEDLKDHRAHVIESLRKAGIYVDPMEDWPAASKEPKVFSQERLKGCNLCVLLVARTRGFVPDGETLSITQLEYMAAIREGIDVLLFLLDDKALWYSDHDKRSADPEVARWRQELQNKHGREIFDHEPKSIDMTGALGRWLAEKSQESGDKLPRQWIDRHLNGMIEGFRDVAVPLARPHRPPVLPLDLIYVPLKLRMQRHSPESNQPTWTSLLKDQRVALTGDAGSGKSTLLRYVALQVAMRLRDQSRAADTRGSPEPAGTTRQDTTQVVIETPRIPIFLDLASSASELLRGLEDETRHVAEIQPQRWLPVLASRLRLTEQQTQALLGNGNVLLLLDGLDEVPDPREREILVDAIDRMQRHFNPLHAQNHVIVACREPAWGTGDAFAHFEKVAIQPMDRETIHEYISRWCRAVWGDQAAEILKSLEKSFSSSPAVGDFAANPQMSTLLALVEYDGPLPKQQALLFEHFVLKLGKAEADRARQATRGHLVALAIEMQRSTSGTGEPLNALKVQKARLLLGKRLQPQNGQQRSIRALRDAGEALLNTLEVGTGLLHVDGSDDLTEHRSLVRFKHRTFQEYLAACYYADEGADELLKHVTDPAWSKVLALTCGILTQIDEAEVTSLLERILQTPQLPEGGVLRSATLVEWAPRVAAASICLAELASYELEEETLAPARHAHALILPLLGDASSKVDIQTRARIADGLGSIFDPRLIREARWVTVPAGPFLQGSEADEAWIQERPQMKVFLEEFRIQRWPVTVAEYRQFVEDAKGYKSDKWWQDEIGRQWRNERCIQAPREWEQNRSRGNRPVTGVSWWEAQAFCRWYTTVNTELPDGWTVQLPCESQWEKAARGGVTPEQAQGTVADAGERFFPWGNAWQEGAANCAATGLQQVVPVGLFPSGHSPYALWDMAGNISEHCQDGFGPYPASGAANGIRLDYSHGHAVRGGSFASQPLDLRVTYRFGLSRDARDETVGFRCVSVPKKQ